MQKVCVRSFSDNLSSKILAYWYEDYSSNNPSRFLWYLKFSIPCNYSEPQFCEEKTGELTGGKTEKAGTHQWSILWGTGVIPHGGGKSSDKV